ncbi:hypothetical protein acsn021_23660 [Anaerocolumna cellulosilytica]|uniref:Phospholipase C n=1 Tax=Anaerocolumna cellulosilytica TaxID=433286 RepID=A0A6S6R417_9FIRM|nr:zinc dependent phospholipase C family protein [Anaerocolumna cellulosilytica]MBB5193989.1 phospholipase C [Anaerocolumna cellulosilytica]BCJ94797.1 hypothetical protein acsn021_23660 [Anaerocolumna cellulosilytica]
MKKGLKKLICYVCMLLMISSSVTVFASIEEKELNGLPEKVIAIANGSDEIYELDAPILREAIDESSSVLDGISVQFVSGGNDHTHQYIVASALTILYRDQGNSVMNSEANALEMMANTDWPDKLGNETDYGTFAGHFYNPKTGVNWLGQSSPTAKTRAVEYFNRAVASYNAGNVTEAFKYIGRGTHYVSDVNVPHHASNLTALNSNHSEFEKYVDVNRTSFYINGNTLANGIYQTAVNSSVGDLIHGAALKSYALVEQAQQKDTYESAARQSVQNAITTVAQYLYKFGKTVGIY